jgi:hypothetical protein
MEFRLTLVVVLTTILTGYGAGAAEKGHCDDALNTPSTSQRLALPGAVLYSSGVRSALKLTKLSHIEYEQRVREDSFDPDTILLIDHLPLNLDLPMVAGIIVSSPLRLRGSHPELQALKMGIPLIYVAGAFELPDIANFNHTSGFVTLRAGAQAQLEWNSSQPSTYGSTQISVLPQKTDRSAAEVVCAARANDFPLPVIGAKFFGLADLKLQVGPNLRIPDVCSVTSGFLEKFKSDAQFRGLSLEKFLAPRIQTLLNSADETQIRQTLGEIREAIMAAELPGFFSDLESRLKSIYGNSALSVRSNNEVEDLIGAGLFTSVKVKEISAAALEKAVRAIWVSMYTYRSFRIRRFWGFREENLSMPVLVHPFVPSQVSGTGSFALEGNQVVLNLSLVFGSQFNATNPDPNARFQELRVVLNDDNQMPLSLPPGFDFDLGYGLSAFVKSLRPWVEKDLKELLYSPASVDIEFVFPSYTRPVLLQYKARPNLDVVQQVLKGELRLEDLKTYRSSKKAVDLNSVLKVLSQNRITTLTALNKPAGHKYAVINVNGVRRVIVWNGIRHETVREMLKTINASITWDVCGYVALDPIDSALLFTNPGAPDLLRDQTDLVINTEDRKAILSQGLANEASMSSALFQKAQSIRMESLREPGTYQGIPMPDLSTSPKSPPPPEEQTSWFRRWLGR